MRPSGKCRCAAEACLSNPGTVREVWAYRDEHHPGFPRSIAHHRVQSSGSGSPGLPASGRKPLQTLPLCCGNERWRKPLDTAKPSGHSSGRRTSAWHRSPPTTVEPLDAPASAPPPRSALRNSPASFRAATDRNSRLSSGPGELRYGDDHRRMPRQAKPANRHSLLRCGQLRLCGAVDETQNRGAAYHPAGAGLENERGTVSDSLASQPLPAAEPQRKRSDCWLRTRQALTPPDRQRHSSDSDPRSTAAANR